MAVTRDAIVPALKALKLTSYEIDALIDAALDNGHADGIPTYAPLSGLLITVHHAGDNRFTIEIH